MKLRWALTVALAGVFALVAQAGASAAGVPRYQLTVFGPTLPSWTPNCPDQESPVGPNYAAAINNAGTITGSYTYHCDGSVTSFVRQPSGTLSTSLLPRSGFDDSANAINARGDLAGLDTTAVGVGGPTHPAASIGGVAMDLGNLGWPGPPALESYLESGSAFGISDTGSVVGTAGTAEFKNHAFLWRENRMRDLGVLAGRTYSSANAINGNRIVGVSYVTTCYAFYYRQKATFCQDGRAVTFDSSGVHVLPTLGGKNSSANDVNASGVVVGGSTTVGEGAPHAFSYSGGVIKDLGPGVAAAINTSGLIVGSNRLYRDRQALDLNSLVVNPVSGFTITEARDINDTGQIVGWGMFDTFVPPIAEGHPVFGPQAFLLTPVA